MQAIREHSVSLTIIYPEDDFENVQFEIQTEDENLREGQLYFNGLWGMFTVCSIKIVKTGGKTVVMVSELTGNPGEPIRKIFDKIATFIHSRLLSQLPPADIVWVEHYQDAGYIPFLKGNHVFFEVLFRYKRNGRLHEYSLPKRRAMNNEQLLTRLRVKETTEKSK